MVSDRGPFIQNLLVLLILSPAFVSCAKPPKGNEDGVVTECFIPNDQVGTISGRWKALEVPLALDSGSHFTAYEKEAYTNAIETWNSHYGAALGLRVLDYGDPERPRELQEVFPASICQDGKVYNATTHQFTGAVMIYKRTIGWPDSKKDAIATTTRCPVQESPVPRFESAVIELNYQNFFDASKGQKVPDLESVLTHELGHLIGLEHSCEKSVRDGVPFCSSRLPKDYLNAVMYPSFDQFKGLYGVPRTKLSANDQSRANCLYQDYGS